MRALWEQLAGHFLQRFIGPTEAMAGALLAFALWCFDYARAEWSPRKRYSIPLWFAGAGIFIAVLIFVGNLPSATGCVVFGLVYYVGLRVALGPPGRACQPARRA
jgi:hypothetical protein